MPIDPLSNENLDKLMTTKERDKELFPISEAIAIEIKNAKDAEQARNEIVNVLIEPSLLLNEQSLDQVIKNLYPSESDMKRYQFFVPSRFIHIIEEVDTNIENILFFRNGAKLVDIKYLRDKLEYLEKENLIRMFEITQDHKDKFPSFYESLLGDIENKILAEILFEEWIFLQEKSWIISGIKKPFDYFIKAGAVGIEFGKKTLDFAVKRTLKPEYRPFW